eukprot:15479688-Alexandrium_andersonii.AAC.1
MPVWASAKIRAKTSQPSACDERHSTLKHYTCESIPSRARALVEAPPWSLGRATVHTVSCVAAGRRED